MSARRSESDCDVPPGHQREEGKLEGREGVVHLLFDNLSVLPGAVLSDMGTGRKQS